MDAPQYTGAEFSRAGVMAGLGKEIGNTGEIVYRHAEVQEQSKLEAQAAEFQSQTTTALMEQVQKGTLDVEKFSQDLQTGLDKMGEGIQGGRNRRAFEGTAARLKSHFMQSAVQGSAELAGARATANFSTTLKARSSSLMSDPSQFEFTLGEQDKTIDGLVANMGLPAAKAEELRVKSRSDLAESAVRGWIKARPDVAKADLDSGKWDGFIGGDLKKQLYGELTIAENAREADVAHRRAEAKRVMEEQQKATKNDFIAKWVKGELSPQSIVESNLDPEDKKAYINMVKADAEGGPRRTDPATFNTLFKNIHLPDSDPNKIRDEKELNQYFLANKLKKEDFQWLRGEINGRRTEEGRIEGDLKEGIVDIAAGKLTKSNPMTGMRDPDGDERLQKFKIHLLREFDAGKRAGKNPTNMLTPGHPDYLGGLVNQYIPTQDEVFKSQMRYAMGSEPMPMASNPGASPTPSGTPTEAPKKEVAPRLPGETIQQWRKRVKGE